jgi:hypothetical protein
MAQIFYIFKVLQRYKKLAMSYQLKVVLQGISPMIWRRLLVSGDSTIVDLHYMGV